MCPAEKRTRTRTSNCSCSCSLFGEHSFPEKTNSAPSKHPGTYKYSCTLPYKQPGTRVLSISESTHVQPRSQAPKRLVAAKLLFFAEETSQVKADNPRRCPTDLEEVWRWNGADSRHPSKTSYAERAASATPSPAPHGAETRRPVPKRVGYERP